MPPQGSVSATTRATSLYYQGVPPQATPPYNGGPPQHQSLQQSHQMPQSGVMASSQIPQQCLVGSYQIVSSQVPSSTAVVSSLFNAGSRVDGAEKRRPEPKSSDDVTSSHNPRSVDDKLNQMANPNNMTQVTLKAKETNKFGKLVRKTVDAAAMDLNLSSERMVGLFATTNSHGFINRSCFMAVCCPCMHLYNTGTEVYPEIRHTTPLSFAIAVERAVLFPAGLILTGTYGSLPLFYTWSLLAGFLFIWKLEIRQRLKLKATNNLITDLIFSFVAPWWVLVAGERTVVKWKDAVEDAVAQMAKQAVENTEKELKELEDKERNERLHLEQGMARLDSNAFVQSSNPPAGGSHPAFQSSQYQFDAISSFNSSGSYIPQQSYDGTNPQQSYQNVVSTPLVGLPIVASDAPSAGSQTDPSQSASQQINKQISISDVAVGDGFPAPVTIPGQTSRSAQPSMPSRLTVPAVPGEQFSSRLDVGGSRVVGGGPMGHVSSEGGPMVHVSSSATAEGVSGTFGGQQSPGYTSENAIVDLKYNMMDLSKRLKKIQGSTNTNALSTAVYVPPQQWYAGSSGGGGHPHLSDSSKPSTIGSSIRKREIANPPKAGEPDAGANGGRSVTFNIVTRESSMDDAPNSLHRSKGNVLKSSKNHTNRGVSSIRLGSLNNRSKRGKSAKSTSSKAKDRPTFEDIKVTLNASLLQAIICPCMTIYNIGSELQPPVANTDQVCCAIGCMRLCVEAVVWFSPILSPGNPCVPLWLWPIMCIFVYNWKEDLRVRLQMRAPEPKIVDLCCYCCCPWFPLYAADQTMLKWKQGVQQKSTGLSVKPGSIRRLSSFMTTSYRDVKPPILVSVVDSEQVSAGGGFGHSQPGGGFGHSQNGALQIQQHPPGFLQNSYHGYQGQSQYSAYQCHPPPGGYQTQPLGGYQTQNHPPVGHEQGSYQCEICNYPPQYPEQGQPGVPPYAYQQQPQGAASPDGQAVPPDKQAIQGERFPQAPAASVPIGPTVMSSVEQFAIMSFSHRIRAAGNSSQKLKRTNSATSMGGDREGNAVVEANANRKANVLGDIDIDDRRVGDPAAGTGTGTGEKCGARSVQSDSTIFNEPAPGNSGHSTLFSLEATKTLGLGLVKSLGLGGGSKSQGLLGGRKSQDTESKGLNRFGTQSCKGDAFGAQQSKGLFSMQASKSFGASKSISEFIATKSTQNDIIGRSLNLIVGTQIEPNPNERTIADPYSDSGTEFGSADEQDHMQAFIAETSVASPAAAVGGTTNSPVPAAPQGDVKTESEEKTVLADSVVVEAQLPTGAYHLPPGDGYPSAVSVHPIGTAPGIPPSPPSAADYPPARGNP